MNDCSDINPAIAISLEEEPQNTNNQFFSASEENSIVSIIGKRNKVR